MRRRIRCAQNTRKALEVRLEAGVGIYYVILSAPKNNLRPICMDGNYSSGIGSQIMFDRPYSVNSFATYNNADRKYKDYLKLNDMKEVRSLTKK